MINGCADLTSPPIEAVAAVASAMPGLCDRGVVDATMIGPEQKLLNQATFVCFDWSTAMGISPSTVVRYRRRRTPS